MEYILKQVDIDILISDYEMPQMNGFELAKLVHKKNHKVRLIIMSGHNKCQLEQICKKYDLVGKVELASKSNMEFFTNLKK